LSILESSRHELRIAHGLTLMTPSLRGWEAFPTPGALTHTSISWAFSPPAPQVPGVTPGSPLCPWCFGHSFWRGARQASYSPYQLLYGREPILPSSVQEKLAHVVNLDDPNVWAQCLHDRPEFFQKAMPMTMENLNIAQHRDTLRYARIRSGAYRP
jgi:hypothetical protein